MRDRTEFGDRAASAVRVHHPQQNQNRIEGILAAKHLGKNPERLLDMLFDGLQRNMQPLGDLPVFHPLKTAEDENLAAALRKRIRDTLDLALQLLIKIRVFGLVIGKTEIIETFFPPLRSGRIREI